MERARATWTDERLDDLTHRMDEGFRRVGADIRGLRALMLQLGAGTIATMIVGFASLLAAQLA